MDVEPTLEGGWGINEKEFQTEVMNTARATGWSVRHFHDSRRQVVDSNGHKRLVGDKDAAGWPDLAMWHPSRGVVIAELKGPKTPVSPDQTKTLESLAVTAMSMAIGEQPKLRVHLWRPDDFPGIVVPLLTKGTGPILYGV